MQAINPITVSQDLRLTYGRYLESLIEPRDNSVRIALKNAIREAEHGTNSLVRGPFLEAQPPYVKGPSIRELVGDGILERNFLDFPQQDLPIDRPLYAHQVSAIERVTNGHSILVSTGTGSGKTESFLLPIINSLFIEKNQSTLNSGVRALLLYPMNALANDQVKRLRKLLANQPQITFGRYTGETLEDHDKALQQFRARESKDPTPNEMISRQQIRENPPHILLTNYAMLEYLLLRPTDTPLFEGPSENTWSFIVADEAHTYDGAHGIEVAYLLRKLRNRVDPESKIITIGTTATIGKDKEAICQFAESFFGNKFDISSTSSPDLIEPQRADLPVGKFGPLSESDWLSLDNDENLSANFLQGVEIFDFVSNEVNFIKLRNFLSQGPKTTEAAALEIWGDSNLGIDAILSMVNLASRLRGSDGEPALSARFHIMARASEGIFSCLRPIPHLSLVRHENCFECEAPTFELAGCRKCGAEYYAGTKLEVGLKSYFSPSAGKRDIAVAFHSLADTELNEDEEVYDDGLSEVLDAVTEALCISCGLFISNQLSSCPECNSEDIRKVILFGDRPELLTKCFHCSARGRGILRRLESGGDAAAAVLATELYSHLPPDEAATDDYPGSGRKLMVFSDSRQQAAYFAPYMDESYGRILWRKIIFQALSQFIATAANPKDVRVTDIEATVVELASRASLFLSSQSSNERYKIAREQLQLEIVSTDRALNLEGTNLVSWRIALPESADLYLPFAQFGLDHFQARAFVETLLNSLREAGAISAPDGVDQSIDAFSPRRGPLFVRLSGADTVKKTYSWLPSRNVNGRIDFASRVLAKVNLEGREDELLRGAWRMLTEHKDFQNVFVQSSTTTQGVRYQLNHKVLQLNLVSQSAEFFECSLCKRLSPVSVLGVCPRYKCDGQLEPMTPTGFDRSNHYRRLYSEGPIIGMVAREHTAQLANTEAAQVQADFIAGKVNLLSSSTTFELGVDVGELQSVFLRNVPPATANYLQRAGRAGRRSDSAALILTYAQKRPHDLAKFADPVSLISGRMRAPFVDLDNSRILTRHIYSVLFAAFWREFPETFGDANQLALVERAGQSNLRHLLEWVENHKATLYKSFEKILPTYMSGAGAEIWSEALRSLRELLTEVETQFRSYVNEYQDLIKQKVSDFTDPSLSNAQQKRASAIANRLKDELHSILTDDAIGFLSKRNLLPKYGFPVDTVNLIPRMTDQGSSAIDLSRDLALAIFDYAPGRQVIANKQIWESIGIATVPGKEVEYKKFAQCLDCSRLTILIAADETKILECSHCASSNLSATSMYMIPKWGFIARLAENKSTDSVRRTSWNRDLYLAEPGKIDLDNVPLVSRSSVIAELQNIAKLLVVNNGNSMEAGYNICQRCNAAVEGGGLVPREHQDPLKPDFTCRGMFELRVKLGHLFETDLVKVRFEFGPSSSINAVDVTDSVEQAIIQAASDLLQIARDDIDIVHLSSSPKHIEFAIVDAVPAGAGFAPMIGANLDAVINHSMTIVERCNCGEETSCYQCLRTYSNQRIHEKLKRNLAISGLQALGH